MVVEYEIKAERIIIKMNDLFILLKLAIRLRLLSDLIPDVIVNMNLEAYIKLLDQRLNTFLLPRIDKDLFEIV